MKKLIAVVVAMMLALAFTACAQEMKKDEMPKDDMMKAEGMPKETLDKVENLKKDMKPDMGEVLRRNKGAMKERLASAICDRYYYTAGIMENLLKGDKQVRAAAELLADPMRYKAILSKPAK